MAESIISTAEPKFTYENIKNNQKIRDQWVNYILQKSKDKRRQSLLTQFLGSNTLQINKLTPESFDTINKILGAMYDPSSRLNNDVQYAMNTLKTYGYPQQVLDSFKQNIDKILANTKDNNRINTANQYIDQFLGDKQDLRRLDPAPGKSALDQQPQKAGNKNNSGGAQGTQGTQGAQAGNGTYASPEVPRGGTKTIGFDDPYDPNPGNVSLAYVMRNAPEQERRDALINKWNRENGRESVPYVPGTEIPAGRLNRSSSTGYATGKGMLTSGSNGSYSSQEGMQSPMPASDNWKFREAWKDPMAIIGQFGRGAFTDDEYNQLVNHAVNDLGYNKDIFSGSRFV